MGSKVEANPIYGCDLANAEWRKEHCDSEAKQGYTRLPSEDWCETPNQVASRTHEQVARDDFKTPDLDEGVSFRQRI